MRTPDQLQKLKRHLKANPTQYELIFEGRLKRAKIRYKKQMMFGFYILDFCLLDYMVNIEIDGLIHEKQKEHDIRRDNFLYNHGFAVIRIKNNNVNKFVMKSLLSFPQKTQKELQIAVGRAAAIKGNVYKRFRWSERQKAKKGLFGKSK